MISSCFGDNVIPGFAERHSMLSLFGFAEWHFVVVAVAADDAVVAVAAYFILFYFIYFLFIFFILVK